MRRALLLGVLGVCAVALADPGGKKWQQSSLPVPYRVFTHSAINGVSSFGTSVLPAVQSGFARWDQVKCQTGTATTWRTTYAGTFSSPGNSTAVANDATNRVLWLGGSDWLHGSQTLGLTTTTYYTSTGQIIDGDMELNDDVRWKLGGSTTGQVDVESIITHEAGHFMGLDHSAPTSAVMYAYYDRPNGEIKRALTSLDISDVCTVYPPVAGSGGDGVQGDLCTGNAQCGTTAPACRGAPGAGSLICTRECSTSSGCPTGYTCQTSTPAGSTGKACLPPVGAPDLCRFCTSHSQCSTGQCVTNGPQNWCTRTCLQASDCGAGYDCVQGTSSKVCAPTSNKCPTAQCTGPTGCPVGYACTNGMCEASGNPGDRCEVSVYCRPCSICIGTLTEAYCRGCCTGGAGSTCSGCNNSSCPSGYACTGVNGSTDAICYPSAGVDQCQYCDQQNPCKPGLSCYSGRCHAACNPAAPGACAACIDQGNGTGYCACGEEAAGTGSPCGQLATGVVACTTGNACVGLPKTCRARCDLARPGSCPSGEACQAVDGQAVCVPGNEPGQRCNACTSTGGCATGLTCVSGRCYEPCNVSMPACTTCVDAATNVGVCACSDQLASVGQQCGVVSGAIKACGSGTVCVGGVCRLQCNPWAAACAAGETCVASGSAGYCQPPATEVDAGSGGGGGGGGGGGVQPPADGGTARPGTNNAGCGCTGGGAGALASWALLGWVGLARRRRAERGTA